MKKVIIASFLLLIGFFAVSSKQNSIEPISDQEVGIVQGIQSPVETAIKSIGQEDVLVLDVRTDVERSEEYVGGSIHIDLAEIKKGRLPEVSKDTKIFVYCRSGNRAGQAEAALKEAGYSKVINIGGLSDWKVAGGGTVYIDKDCLDC